VARIILHSDDFGLHAAINDAIAACARAGVLSSASLLANGAAAEEAAALAKELPQLGIGVHLNIVRGRPLSRPDEIPSIVDENGRFFSSMTHLIARSRLGRLRVSDLCTEYRRQIAWVVDRGIEPSHLDGEKHSHILLPEAAEALAQVAAEFAIKRVRRIHERPLLHLASLPRTSRAYWRQRAKVWLLEWRTRQVERRWHELVSPTLSFGLAAVGCPVPKDALNALTRLFALPAQQTIEWFFHVGNDFDYGDLQPDWGPFWLTDARRGEARFLLSQDVRALIGRHPGQLISYRDLG
jgi:predicted glycoside hydrolase/deacetylase ChbG (UPF0249 family)